MLKKPLAAGHFWNINLPSPITADVLVPYQICPLDEHPHKYHYRREVDLYHYEGVIHDRPRTPGSDVDVCFGGQISITCLEISP
jgi:5'-nucleotidase